MAHAQKSDFVFRRNGRVHLNRRGRQFSRLLAAELCVSAVVMLDTPMFRGSVKSTGYPLNSPVSPSLPLPCVTVCHHISTGLCQLDGCVARLGPRGYYPLPQYRKRQDSKLRSRRTVRTTAGYGTQEQKCSCEIWRHPAMTMEVTARMLWRRVIWQTAKVHPKMAVCLTNCTVSCPKRRQSSETQGGQ